LYQEKTIDVKNTLGFFQFKLGERGGNFCKLFLYDLSVLQRELELGWDAGVIKKEPTNLPKKFHKTWK
jgi:hypothetical protein